ncbi:MAG: AAA family ATPase [Odoribacteraceae bacterium]|jgi:exodeoxyribonuclease-5|nr:AAA family ATPase [Odoribacteraceae bacterium]
MAIVHEYFKRVLADLFGLAYTSSQGASVDAFVTFFFRDRDRALFLLKGHAGTGKTSLVAAIVNTLERLHYRVILLAPTGRAAKVFSAYAGMPAFTIHKKIYRRRENGLFDLGFNTSSETLFFVDEASMIGAGNTDTIFGSGSLLDDLFLYVYNGRQNRLVFIGDDAQLPPVGTPLGPALDHEYLRRNHDVEVNEASLTETTRQATDSGILFNATRIRKMIGRREKATAFLAHRFPDVTRISGGDFLEALEREYSVAGEEETVIICRSNRQANRFNAGIRARLFYREEALGSGDRVMIVHNNYFWVDRRDNDFIANGDVATVTRVRKHVELYGFHFAHASLDVQGRADEIDAWMLLDTLTTDQPALSRDDFFRLQAAVEEDYATEASRRKRLEKVRENEFFNALQIKYAYAITGHKAQGGQWNAVFLDAGRVNEDCLDDDYWRWLYTAFTRARERLFLVNFKNDWFEGEPAADSF